ncbi:MAG: protein translocase subunit SecD [Planctomycetota bacterium]|nr:protein translocase subunit SecD [Planctomycetota bacterium]MCX8040032.1 protein translocase subunit SecD [Planctomycetota bacterium]MDW8372596.1 protein translocase subunit SecD [Planctomycetota bacterium]
MRFTGIVVIAVFVTALFLLFLQNRVLVGEQELRAEVRAAASETTAARVFDVILKDIAGNPVDALAAEAEEMRRRLQGEQRDAAIPFHELALDTASGHVRLTAPADVDELALRQRLTGRVYRRANDPRPLWHVNLGIDLRGGVEFTCRLKNDLGQVVPADDEVVAVLRSRLDERGLTEPIVARLSNGDVQIVIPGGTRADAARTRKVLETTGRLEFREVIAEYPNADFPSRNAGDPQCAWVDLGGGRWGFNPAVPRGTRQDIIAPKEPPPGLAPSEFLHLGPVRVSGKEVADAFETIHEGQPAVGITFTAVGASKNFEFTSGVKERGDAKAGTGRIAIVFDGIVKSDPRVVSPSSRDCVISGRFTSEEIRDLRGVLKAGSLAVTPEILSERVVGPTLGIQEIERALITLAWCMAAIVAFLAWYYRRLGLVALAAMAACGALTWTTLSVFGATLTLPGIAGLILAIAMSIDTNVLVFERIREELKEDKGLPAAIEAGYDRAFLTILDANLTTMATGLVLYVIGTGPIKGFGLTLIIGIAISMFSGVYLGRFLTELLCRRRQTVSLASVFRPLPFPYVRLRRAMYALTALTALAGIGWFAFGHRLTGGGFDRNFDIEFTGGTMVQVSFTREMDQEAIAAALQAAWERVPEAQRAASLIDPREIQYQPYFASLAEIGRRSRQWVFRVRDVEGAQLERQRHELEQERGRILREIDAKRSATPPDIAGARALERERLDPLKQRIAALTEQIADRTQRFKRELGAVFGEAVAPEGSEVAAIAYAEQTLSVTVITMEPASPLQARAIADRLAHLGRQVAVSSEGTAMTLRVQYATRPRPPAGALEALPTDPVGQRCLALLVAGGMPEAEARDLAAVASPVIESLVDAAASQRVAVAQPFPASQHFSSQVAGRMQWQALIACTLALLAMLLYIAARFELAYGLGAAVSLLHVVIQTIGLIVLLGIRIDLTVIAAILTVIGYAINDTIVVYDRIREYVGKMVGKPLEAVIDAAIADTMPRTILTGGMVIASLIFILLFAGDSLEAFAATLLIGICLGTFSSVFVASPLLLSFRRESLIAPPPAPPAEAPAPA